MKKIFLIISIFTNLIFYNFVLDARVVKIMGTYTEVIVGPDTIFVICPAPMEPVCFTCNVNLSRENINTNVALFKHNTNNQLVGEGHTHVNVEIINTNGVDNYKITPLPGDQIITNYNAWEMAVQ